MVIDMQDGKNYYEMCKAKGLDYNYFGDWQVSYGKFVIPVSNILPKSGKEKLTLLDIGTACGVNLRGIKLTGLFKQVIGIDINPYMINLGKETHGFSNDELTAMDAVDLLEYFEEGSFDMVHCTQTLEHIKEDDIPVVLESIHEILVPTGQIFLIIDAPGANRSPEEILAKDPTHVTAQPRKWWESQLTDAKFKLDRDAHMRFTRTKFSPDNSKQTFHDYYKDEWTLIIANKK